MTISVWPKRSWKWKPEAVPIRFAVDSALRLRPAEVPWRATLAKNRQLPPLLSPLFLSSRCHPADPPPPSSACLRARSGKHPGLLAPERQPVSPSRSAGRPMGARRSAGWRRRKQRRWSWRRKRCCSRRRRLPALGLRDSNHYRLRYHGDGLHHTFRGIFEELQKHFSSNP